MFGGAAMVLRLVESLSKSLTGIVTRLVNANNGLTKAARERLLTLLLIASFFEIVLIANIILLWLLYR
jgi:hypothetical protein